MLDELRRWIELADERLAGIGASVYVIAGNDDPWSVDDMLRLRRAGRLPATARSCTSADHEMISSATRTQPLAHPARARGGRALRAPARPRRSAGGARAAIFNLHVPPYDRASTPQTRSTTELTSYARGPAARDPCGSYAVTGRSSRRTSRARTPRPHPRITGPGPDRSDPRAQRGIRVQQRTHPRSCRHPIGV